MRGVSTVFLQNIFIIIILVTSSLSSFSIDLTKDGIVLSHQELEKITRVASQSNENLNVFQQLARALQACGMKSTVTGRAANEALTKYMFAPSNNVTCNDGSPAGYYIRRSYNSKKWIIFLEGGWYCFDKKSCNERWARMQSLMSSKNWPQVKNVGGLLSTDQQQNPHWWNANHIYVPYCSSDSWSGTAKKQNGTDSFAFMGSHIIEEVIKDLLPKGLFHAKKVYLTGSSAGGTGVILNLDRVADIMQSVGSRADVRGIADSGWFIDNKPYQEANCVDPRSCSPMEALKKGISLWSGRVPDRCKLEHPNDYWKCYLGYHAYPSLKAPLFVFQWLFDEAQMTIDNVGAPVTKSQWNYIHEMGKEVARSLTNVSAVFAPACISHTILTKPNWGNVKINGISLIQAIRCWEEQRHEHNHHNHHPRHQDYHRLKPKNNPSIILPTMGNMPLSRKLLIQRLFNSRSNHMSFKVKNKNANDDSIATNNPSRRHKRKRKHRRRKKNRRRRNRKRKNRRGNKNRSSRSLYKADDHVKHAQSHHKNGCSHHFIEQCSWPQCNPTCPKLHNPFTGEEMDFLELLKSFGLDMSNIASALGINEAALKQMDHSTLLQLLTTNQQN